MRKIFFALSAIILLICSCQNTEEYNIVDEESRLDNETFVFLYKGEKYASKQQVINEDEVFFFDERVSKLAKELASNTSLVTYVHSDGIIEYFDNEEDFNNNIVRIQEYEDKLNSATRSEQVYKVKRMYKAKGTVFENSKLGKKRLEMEVNLSKPSVYHNMDDLAAAGLRYKISSLLIDGEVDEVSSPGPLPPKIQPGAVFLMLHKHYPAPYPPFTQQGRISVRFIVTIQEPHSEVHYLKSIPLYPGSGRNWNDACDAVELNYKSW